MLRMSLNQASLDLDLSPRAGFLVKAGEKGSNLLYPNRPDLGALRTRVMHGQGDAATFEDTVFIPGSTLKGVLRSAGERALRSLGDDLACDPHNRDSRCQRGPEARTATAPDRHRALCLACRIFGSQQAAGRLMVADALPSPDNEKAWDNANRTSTRSGVSIDRRTGGPARGKLFEAEVVTGGTFRARLTLDNFQLWQLALVGILLEDLAEGELRIGSGRTRGLGAFSLRVRKLDLWQIGSRTSPAGVGTLRPDLIADYGWLPEPALAEAAQGESHRAGTRWRLENDAEARAVLAGVLRAAWPPVLSQENAA